MKNIPTKILKVKSRNSGIVCNQVGAKKLILFTNGFPCVKEGEEFLEAELELLSVEFESILIYVLNEGKICRNIPLNASVKVLKPNRTIKVRTVLFKYIFQILRIFLNDQKDSAAKTAISKNRKFYINVLLGNFILKDTLEREIKLSSNEKLYSYWCGPWFDILMLLDKKTTDRITFRAHGYDFDPNQRSEKFIPYRNFLIKKNPFISFVSQFGYDSYSKAYPKYSNRKVFRLGVKEQKISAREKSSEIIIVSCSSFITLKRVHLIVEILKNISIEIKWIHFGDGSLFSEVKEKAKKQLGSNIKSEFKGYVAHPDVIKFYKENYVDLFINVSELEGIPVSIMEAISFGIPVTGCNVCGVPEIVTKETGFLFDLNFKPEEAAKQIQDYLVSEESKRENLRISAKEFWNKNFNADKNYKSFIKDCLLN